MTLRHALRVAATCAMAAVALTCKDTPSQESGPTAGWLAVGMTAPNGDDGGIMFVVTGGIIDSARSTFPNILSRAESTTSMRVVVGGSITPGKIAEVWVTDTRKVAEYSATPLEVAARGTFMQRALTGYALTLTRVP